MIVDENNNELFYSEQNKLFHRWYSGKVENKWYCHIDRIVCSIHFILVENLCPWRTNFQINTKRVTVKNSLSFVDFFFPSPFEWMELKIIATGWISFRSVCAFAYLWAGIPLKNVWFIFCKSKINGKLRKAEHMHIGVVFF